ncbi:MAG: hypothetical protein ETSY1_27940 [Candidatus Entotheonella factor]|uniref:Uncharacterized protein n=1 Tax=Entotheonella factor TaxID=1429438 RepID=W4LDD0_ENTF1|nr:MAG: hypothetical protein ETSY1_27940 [Candidatus Entotheonella factor]
MDLVQLHAQTGHDLGQGVIADRGFNGKDDQANA